MNYRGDILDSTDIEGATAGTAADPILKYRKIPLNPLQPDYEYPGDGELKGKISRRMQMQNSKDNSKEQEMQIPRSKSQIRLEKSYMDIRNIGQEDQMKVRMPPGDIYDPLAINRNAFDNRRHTDMVYDKAASEFYPMKGNNI